jgi:sulfite dehydrogenase (cytochrome) subunit B
MRSIAMVRSTPIVRAAAAALAVLACGLAASAFAGTKSIVLPPDGVSLRPSELPGFAKAQSNCVGCHSAEYMLYQPSSAPRAYWDAMVKRMKDVFKAPVPDADMPAIVDYLAKTYGNEQPGLSRATTAQK